MNNRNTWKVELSNLLQKRYIGEFPKDLPLSLWRLVMDYYGIHFGLFLRCPASGKELTDPVSIKDSEFAGTYYDRETLNQARAENKQTPLSPDQLDLYTADFHWLFSQIDSRYVSLDEKEMNDVEQRLLEYCNGLDDNLAQELKFNIAEAKIQGRDKIDLITFFDDASQFPLARKKDSLLEEIMDEKAKLNFENRKWIGSVYGLIFGCALAIPFLVASPSISKLPSESIRTVLRLPLFVDELRFVFSSYNYLIQKKQMLSVSGFAADNLNQFFSRFISFSIGLKIISLSSRNSIHLVTHILLTLVPYTVLTDIALKGQKKISFNQKLLIATSLIGEISSRLLAGHHPLIPAAETTSTSISTGWYLMPIMNIPRLILGARELIKECKQNYENPAKMIAPKRDSLGFRGGHTFFTAAMPRKLFRLLIPLTVFALSCMDQEPWCITLACMLYHVLSNSALDAPELDWQPHEHVLPKLK